MNFSILIPTWNNLPYLKLCIGSIKRHSKFDHQIIVIVNEGKDGTIQWLEEQEIQYIHHLENVGICVALNSATDLISEKHLVYLNDDMYVLPKWDIGFSQCISTIKGQQFMLSGTMIEPHDTGNKCVIVENYGTDLTSFDENRLLENQTNFSKTDWNGASWPPVLLPTSLWKKVGGMSEEFSPGMYSDPDLSMKLWDAGVRYFRGLGDVRVYHFGSKSTRKLGKNIGRSIFLKKWKMTPNYFYTEGLKMGSDWKGELPSFKVPLPRRILHKIKIARS